MAAMRNDLPNLDETIANVASSLGYSNVKKEQLKVIRSFIQKNDVLAVLPTGFGKTLCFACIPGVMDVLSPTITGSTIVVISPLTALMENQVTSLLAKGLKVASITSEQTDQDIVDDVMRGKYQIVMFTSEMILLNKKWRSMLSSSAYSTLQGLVIDEAHTVKKWGDTFRKVLSRIKEVRSLVPQDVPVMSLTATATRALQRDLNRIIGMKEPIIVALSPSKPNILYTVKSEDDICGAVDIVVKGIEKDRASYPRTIIYCQRLCDCGLLYHHFKTHIHHFTEPPNAPDLPQYRMVDMYHSCTDQDVKDHVLKSFCQPSQLRVVIATVAFGMGIDCPDVRNIFHLGAPEDVESYIQETGRAGRDGLPSTAILCRIKGMRSHTDSIMYQYITNKESCRRQMLFSEFEGYICNAISRCKCCDICAIYCECTECSNTSND